MTVLTILGSIAAIVVAVITIWNADSASRQRQRMQHAVQERRARRRLEQRVEHYRTQPVLVELEQRFAELHAAYSARSVPTDLALLWSRVFVVSRESPLGTPFRYGALELHRNAGAMTVRNGPSSITGSDRLDPFRIPLPPQSAVKPGSEPIAVIKE